MARRIFSSLLSVAVATAFATVALTETASADSLAAGAPTSTFDFADYVVSSSTVSLALLVAALSLPVGARGSR